MPSPHVFPDAPLRHLVTFDDGTEMALYVSASETFGHALLRAGFRTDEVRSVSLEDAPLSYEPDFRSATR